MSKVKLTIDGKEISVPKGTLLIEAAKQAGIVIPRYCYHPGLAPDGNCRMCLIEVEKMPKPIASCKSTVAEGMVVKTNSEEVNKIRRSVMEFLLINHPLDCPTCDQAGECRLQDYYMDYDEVPARFQEEKIHKEKMIDLGANIMLDQERCIACTRCIRVCQEVAGVDELALANRGDHVTITTFPGRKMTNRYAGNTADVCPVGALTNKDFRFKKRVWFLSRTPSVCPGCSRGCNIEIHHEESRVYRLLPRYNPEVNQYWICDEGRYGYHSVNDNRILRPQRWITGGGHVPTLQTASHEEVMDELVSLIRNISSKEIAVVAHAQETNETLQAFLDFAKNTLKTSLLFYSRNDPPHPYSDKILMTADKNPNQAEVDGLGFKPLSNLKKAEGLIILNSLNEKDFEMVEKKNIPILAVFASNESPVASKASVVFPIPTYVEQDGHFTNVQGKVQKINRAFEPRGESQLVVETLKEISELLKISADRSGRDFQQKSLGTVA